MKGHNEMKKAHNEAYDNIKPSKELIDKTFELMKNESKKEKKTYSHLFKNNLRIMTAVACSFILFIGINMYNKDYKDNFNGPQHGEIISGSDTPQINQSPERINISGTVEDVSKEGSRIKVSGKWIIIDENTKFSLKYDGIQVSGEFKVGNYVEGFTLDDLDLPEIRAEYIYLNESK